MNNHKNRKSKLLISISTIRLCLAVGIGLFLGVQFRLLASSTNLFTPTYSDYEQLTLPILDAGSLQAAIRTLHTRSPLFLFGHTTGHSGSGTFQESMAQPGCPWNLTVDKFEYVVDGEKEWAYDVEGLDGDCEMTKTELVPHLLNAMMSKASKLRRYASDEQEEEEDSADDDDDDIGDISSDKSFDNKRKQIGDGAAFIDMGHFHNTGRTLECLAKQLGELSVFVHIRRNRYSIARSFTPQHHEKLGKDDWRRHRRENKLLRRRHKMGISPDDHDRVDIMREIVGSSHKRDGEEENNPMDDEESEDETTIESHRRLDADDEDTQSFVPIPKKLSNANQNNEVKKKPKGKGKKSDDRSHGNRRDEDEPNASNSQSHQSSHAKIEERKRLKAKTMTKERPVELYDRSERLSPSDRDDNDRWYHNKKFKRSPSEKIRRRRECRGHKCEKESSNSTKSNLPQTPCLAQDVINGKNFSKPSVSICPRSTEGRGPVNLIISSDEIWDSLTPFQQFLWYADEIEHRWYTLQKMFYSNYKITPQFRRHIPGGDGKPTFIEVTWDSKDELEDAVNWARQQLGCTPAHFLTNEHPHVKHEKGELNCTHFIWEDLEYRKKMQYNKHTKEILFPPHLPQHVDSSECREDREELELKIRQFSKHHRIPFDIDQWKLPD